MNPQAPHPLPPPMVPPEPNNGTRNVIIGIVAVVVVLLIVAALYLATRPSTSSPTVVPSATATSSASEEVSAEPTATPRATPTEEATRTPKPTPTEKTTPEVTPTEVALVSEPPETEPATEPPATEEPTLPPISPEPSFGLPNEGIALTSPVLLGDPSVGAAVVGALAWNLTRTVNTYTLKAELSNGTKTTATAAGQVTDHRPGDLRAVQLTIDSGTPSATDTLNIALDQMISQDPSTDTADVAAQVTFGTPAISTTDPAEIMVDVTNGSDQQATLTISAGVIRDATLVGVASGTIDLAPGQTGAVTMPVTGQVDSTDYILLDVDSVVIG